MHEFEGENPPRVSDPRNIEESQDVYKKTEVENLNVT